MREAFSRVLRTGLYQEVLRPVNMGVEVKNSIPDKLIFGF